MKVRMRHADQLGSKHTVFLVGCTHEVQLLDTVRGQETEQKEFRELIAALVKRERISFVGEETKQGHRSTGEDVANIAGIPYLNVDVPIETQTQIKKRPATLFDGEKIVDVVNSDEYAKAWNLVREYHMYQTFVDHVCECETSLFICGRAHVHGLERLLREHFDVRAICYGGRLHGCCGTELNLLEPFGNPCFEKNVPRRGMDG
jgi:hypothetical protein